jgi:hypothetical protein
MTENVQEAEIIEAPTVPETHIAVEAHVIEAQRQEWLPLVIDDTYEINTAPPHAVRSRRTGHVVVECLKPNGYMYLHLNGKNRYKHRIVAIQFIPNPQNLPQVHHRNFRRADNRLENLEWVTALDNTSNREGHAGRLFNYIEDLPNTAIKILDFRGWRFNDGSYFFYGGRFYANTRLMYRELHIMENKNGARLINLIDTSGRVRAVNVSQLKRLYGLV